MSYSLFPCLSAQVELDILRSFTGHGLYPCQGALAALALFLQQVIAGSLAAQDFTVLVDADAVFGAAMSFEFWHAVISL